jgi:hypothetical protein
LQGVVEGSTIMQRKQALFKNFYHF